MNRLKLYLNIFQLQEYEISRFWKWTEKHPNPDPLQGKKPLVWTFKAKLLYWWSVILFPITCVSPRISLVFGRMLMLPGEKIWLSILKNKTRNKIAGLKKTTNLKVIGISGSYGKTSMKEILYTLLSGKFRVYRSPESFNTVKGIAKAVDLELDERYEIFICEMGEYKPGDVKEICGMVNPDFGIITGVNEQHGERMGDINHALKTVFELADWVSKKGGKTWINAGDERINNYCRDKRNYENYGTGDYKTPLEQNMEGASRISKYLGVTEKEINTRTKLVKPFRHRLEVIQNEEMTIIDDAYNSNPDGFAAAIKYLAGFPKPHIVITPGIIELGEEAARIHREIGKKMSGTVDNLILVGKNERTENLAVGFGKETTYINELGEWRKAVDVKKRDGTI